MNLRQRLDELRALAQKAKANTYFSPKSIRRCRICHCQAVRRHREKRNAR